MSYDYVRDKVTNANQWLIVSDWRRVIGLDSVRFGLFIHILLVYWYLVSYTVVTLNHRVEKAANPPPRVGPLGIGWLISPTRSCQSNRGNQMKCLRTEYVNHVCLSANRQQQIKQEQINSSNQSLLENQSSG